MSVNKIRKLYDKLFDSCRKISKVGVWVIKLGEIITVLDEDYTINDKRYSDLYDKKYDLNLDIIDRSISDFNNFVGPEKEKIIVELKALGELYLKKSKNNSIVKAVDDFNFEVDTGPFKIYMGKRFPWDSIRTGVWFNIYRDGRVEHFVDGH